jgi:transcriptional regulator with XRE-family HTH domain
MLSSSAGAPEVAEAPSVADCDGLDERAAATLRRQATNARRIAGQTLASVAERSGLSTAYISRIESGSANPTLHTIAQLAAGLGCELADLFGASPPSGATRFEPRFTSLPLLATTPGYHGIWDVTAPDAVTLCARLVRGSAGDHAEPTTHAGEEIIVVLAGTCTVRVGAAVAALRQGESCHLAAMDPHAITDTGEDTLLLVILTEE